VFLTRRGGDFGSERLDWAFLDYHEVALGSLVGHEWMSEDAEGQLPHPRDVIRITSEDESFVVDVLRAGKPDARGMAIDEHVRYVPTERTLKAVATTTETIDRSGELESAASSQPQRLPRSRISPPRDELEREC